MNQIDEKLYTIAKLIQRLETEPRNYGTDQKLTGAEIHLVELIGENDNSSVTEIAGLYGVSKSAISQKLKQLINKGLVEKKVDPENLSRSNLVLTSKGKIAFYAHKHWHETMDGGFQDYYSKLSEEKLAIIMEFLNRFEDLFLGLSSVEE